MRNLPEFAVAYVAISTAGAAVVPMNAWWTDKVGVSPSQCIAFALCVARAVVVAPPWPSFAWQTWVRGSCCGVQEMEYGLLDSNPKVVIADQERFDRMRAFLPTTLSALNGKVLLVPATCV